MFYFKDSGDGFYAVSALSSASPDWVEISEEEYSAANAPQTLSAQERKAAIQSEIDAIEASEYMTRREREGWIVLIEAQAVIQNVSLETLYASNLFYKKLRDVNAQITTLRTELKEIT